MRILLRNACHLKLRICMILLFASIGVIQAQKTTVSGTVSSDDGPVPGASVLIKGTTEGTATDFDGNFSIEAEANDILVFSYLGFISQEIEIGGRTTIDVIMAMDQNVLDEVVVIGYGTQKVKEVTGAVVNLGAETISKQLVSDLGQAIQGQIAGVNVQAASGRPGEASNIEIRGLGSLSPNALEPLYVVDGIPYQANPNIPPEQIASIDVLKDGAAAAVYGTRASNGVIIITTKKGKQGRLNVELNAYSGIQNITSGTPLMNTQQQMYNEEVMLEALGRDPLIFQFNPDALDYDSDFVGDVQNDNAAISNVNLILSGGSENLSLNFNSNYFDQEGVLINSGFNRFSNRLTGEFKKGRFKAFATIGLTEENTEQEPWALYEYSITQRPWQPPLGGLETVGENSVEIPVRNAILYSYLSRELENEDKRKTNATNLAVNAEYEILEGFKVKVNLGQNTWNYRRKFFRPQYLVYNLDGSYNPTASREDAMLNEEYQWTDRQIAEGMLTYEKMFGDHKINLLGVVSSEKFTSKQVGVGVIGLLSNDTPVLGAGSAGTNPTSYDFTNTLTGMLFRAQYNYKEKYLFSASYRRDGSSNFGPDNRYGDFFGISGGWNISEEGFMENVESVNSLKVRASWAEVGNQSIPAYSFASQIESGVNYPFGAGETLSIGAIQRRYADPNIKWETNVSTNFGVDLAMFDNRFTFVLDLYENKREDMLLLERLPSSSGVYHPRTQDIYDVRIINAGNMVNKGVEIAAGYKSSYEREFQWNVSATFTKNKNEVTDLNGVDVGYANGRPIVSLGPNVDYTTFLAEGYEAGAFFLVQNDGVIKTQEELDAYKAIDNSAQLGDIRYIDQLTVDTDGDGVADAADGTINDDDRVYSGSGQADFYSGLNFGANYKGFDLYIGTYYSHGAKIYNGARLYAYTQGRHLEQYSMWSPQNSSSDIPTFRQNAFHANNRAWSDYFLEDGSYFRIRNITLGYSIDRLLSETSGISKARVYLTAQNPFTFTNYNGYDPEVGGDGLFLRGVDRGNYPVTRQVLIGFQLTL